MSEQTYRLVPANEPPIAGEIRYVRQFIRHATFESVHEIEIDPKLVIWNGNVWVDPKGVADA